MTQYRNPFRYLKPVPPKKFLGRWPMVERICLDLTLVDGDSHACIGGRRFGKSSLLAVLHDRLRKPELIQGDCLTLPIKLDFKRYKPASEAASFATILQEVRRRVDVASRSRPRDPSPVKVTLDQDWLDSIPTGDPPGLSLYQFEEALRHILDQLDEAGGPTRLVLLLDEVDDVLRYEWHQVLFDQLRACIYEGDLADKMRLVLAGSRRFLDEVSDQGSPLWNILRLHYLSNLDKAAIDELSQRATDLPEVARQAVWQQSGGHPFLAQYLLHHLWEKGISQADGPTVTQMADRFLHEEQAHLEGWAKAVDIAGLQLYDQFVNQSGWLDEEDLIRAVADQDIPVKRGLIALFYHGFIIHDGFWKRYRRAGDLLHNWYIQEGPRLIKKMLAESEKLEDDSQLVKLVQTFHTGDTYHLTGDFRKAILNIKATLDGVNQNIDALPTADPSIRDELAQLVQQLSEVLQQAPPDRVEQAEAVAQSAELLVNAATAEKPNKTMIQITGEGLKQAAKSVADVMPTILAIATQIVTTISQLSV